MALRAKASEAELQDELQQLERETQNARAGSSRVGFALLLRQVLEPRAGRHSCRADTR